MKKLDAGDYGLMLLDLKLPDIDGMEVLSRSRGRRPAMPVIIITAHGTIETAVESMKLGALDYLQKPFTPKEILALVDRVLSRQELPLGEPAATFETCLEQAMLLIHKREYERAGQFLRRALTMETLRPEPYNLLGCTQELDGNELEAQRLYRAALAVDPSYAPADGNLRRLAQMFRTDRHAPDLGEPKAGRV